MLHVAVVHDCPVIRFGITALLDLDPGVVVVGHGDGSRVLSVDGGGAGLDVLVAPSVTVAGGAFGGGGVPILVVSSSSVPNGGCVDAATGVYGSVAADVSGDEL